MEREHVNYLYLQCEQYRALTYWYYKMLCNESDAYTYFLVDLHSYSNVFLENKRDSLYVE